MTAHLVGELDLSKAELEAMETWLADIRQQTLPHDRFEHYVLIPPARQEFDAATQRPKHWRFSCAGLVWKTYEVAGIHLVALERIAVDRDTLVKTWGEGRVALSERVNERYRLGLDAPPPWRVLLPAHLFHAIRLGRSALPLSPTSEHATFA